MKGQQLAKAALEVRSETAIKRAIVQALNLLPGVVVFPMNVGSVSADYKGKTRFVRFGVKGMADLIGWKQEHFGTTVHVPRFLALEVKRPDQVPQELLMLCRGLHKGIRVSGKARLHAEEQAAFLRMVRHANGIAAVVTSVEEAREAVR